MLEGAGGFSGRWPLCRWVVIAGGTDEVARAAAAAVEATAKAAEEAVAVAAAVAAASARVSSTARKQAQANMSHADPLGYPFLAFDVCVQFLRTLKSES